MPIKKSALKKMRSDKKRHISNLSIISELKTRNKKFENLVATNKLDESGAALKEFVAKLDRAVSKGVIRKNTASRKKSRLAKALKKCLASGKTKNIPPSPPSSQKQESSAASPSE